MARGPRPYWKGFIKFNGVSIGVAIHNAQESASRVKMSKVHKPSGKRINLVPMVDGQRIDNDDVATGYEIDEGQFITFAPGELEDVKIESKRTLDIIGYVDRSAVPSLYIDRPYFMAPSDTLATEGYVIIRDALKKTGKVGISKLCIGGREWLVAISAEGHGLMMTLLRYASEVRDAADYLPAGLAEAKASKKTIDLAAQIIKAGAIDWRPEDYRDEHQVAVQNLIEAKRAAIAKSPNVVSLGAALKARKSA